MDSFEVPQGGAAIELDPWIIRRTIPLEDLQTGLLDEHIQLEMLESIHPGTVRLRVGIGVELIYVQHQEEYGPPVGLNALSYGGGRA